jgi:hypothetical protein
LRLEVGGSLLELRQLLLDLNSGGASLPSGEARIGLMNDLSAQ